MTKRKIIYSVLIGGYDDVPKHVVRSDEWEYVLFTDIKTEEKEINGWQIMPLEHVVENDDTRTSRWYKLNSHLLFDNCLCSIYLDCSIIINGSFIYERANELLKDEKVFISATAHPFRDCIYKEAIACLEQGKDAKVAIMKSVIFLKNEGYPQDNGLFEGGLIYRNHQFPGLKKFNEEWWRMLSSLSRRDQLSFNYVLWKQKIECNLFFKDLKSSFRNSPDFIFKIAQKINNSFIEISNLLLEGKNSKILELEHKLNVVNEKSHVVSTNSRLVTNELNLNIEKLNKIKYSLSYKVFYKIERFLRKPFGI